MAMTVENLANGLNYLIETGEVDPDAEIRVLLPQYRSHASYGIEVIIDDIAVPHLEIDTSSHENFSTYEE
jgi:mannitol/fructose-specific phosphotransferase system IIA component (Ntr-type)